MSEELPAYVVPYLAVTDGAAALDFYARGFGAVEQSRMTTDDGTIAHAEFTIGHARFYLADEWKEMGVRSPISLGGYSVSLSIDVADAPALIDRLAAAGARVERPITDGPAEGTVSGWIVDPYGHRWHIASPMPGSVTP